MLTPEIRAILARLEGAGHAEDVALLRAWLTDLDERLRPHIVADRAAAALARVAELEPTILAAVEAARIRDRAAAAEADARTAALLREGERRWSALSGVGESLRDASAWLAARSAHAMTVLLTGLVGWLLLRLGVVPAPDAPPETPPHEADGGE